MWGEMGRCGEMWRDLGAAGRSLDCEMRSDAASSEWVHGPSSSWCASSSAEPSGSTASSAAVSVAVTSHVTHRSASLSECIALIDAAQPLTVHVHERHVRHIIGAVGNHGQRSHICVSFCAAVFPRCHCSTCSSHALHAITRDWFCRRLKIRATRAR